MYQKQKKLSIKINNTVKTLKLLIIYFVYNTTSNNKCLLNLNEDEKVMYDNKIKKNKSN